MTEATESRMKMTVLGGFLGAGKTTWLRHQLHRGLLEDAFIIVNEAADVPVDDIMLGGASRMAVLAGGCVCCEALDQLIALLRDICDRRVGAGDGARVDAILLETSGLADPGPIVETIRRDPVLVHHVVVSEIVVVVDAVYGLGQLRCEPLGRGQVELADRLVVAKVDEADDASLKRLLATLQRLNPGAALSGAVKGSHADLPAYEDAEAESLPSLDGAVSGAQIFATKLVIDETIDWTALSVWLSALLHARGEDVMRVKGVVRTPAGRLLLQSVRRIVQSPELLPPRDEAGGEDNTLVVIGRGYAAEDLSTSLRCFAGTGLGHANNNASREVRGG